MIKFEPRLHYNNIKQPQLLQNIQPLELAKYFQFIK